MRHSMLRVAPSVILVTVSLAVGLAAGCGAGDSAGPGGKSGFGANGGSGGGADASAGSGGGAGSSGFGGSLFDGSAGSSGGGTKDAELSDVEGGGLQDALPDVENDACSDAGALPPKFPHLCAAPTDDECDGAHDVDPNFPNGGYGNGYDDDCDGLVDEGCLCDPQHAAGTTKPCYLVPPTQVDPNTNKPAGWCAQNSAGTESCVTKGGGENPPRYWDGFCKGAQQPFAHDICAPGDFNCDGVDSNSDVQDCSCKTPTVQCPVDPVVVSPYPNPTDLTQKKNNPLDPNPNTPFIVDGYDWIPNNQGVNATNWSWSITGGDCDNILPHPTFAVYDGANSQTSNRIGTQQSNLGQNNLQHGFTIGGQGSDQHQIWPAFSLSGDYIVDGQFDLDGQHYECTLKVQVRWPGLRAELCWDTVGTGTNHDVDLHLARLQGTSCNASHGWFVSACGSAPSSDDCYYSCASGCRTGNNGFCGGAAPAPGWGYGASPSEACHGWGSLREVQQTCDNPRLDRDNISCDPNVTDPTNAGNFCGPENINLDDPNDGDMFAVGVHYYYGNDAHPHVNIYCNGERKLAFGYDPTTSPATTFPHLLTGWNSGGVPTGGDFWSVARVTWSPNDPDVCKIEPIPSAAPKTTKDGSSNVCVDTNPQNKAGQSKWLFQSGGGVPTGPQPSPFTAGNWFCWH